MIQQPYLQSLRDAIRQKNETIAAERLHWIEKNSYYYEQILKSLRFIVEEGANVLHLRCNVGYLLDGLKPRVGIGVEDSETMVGIAKTRYPHLTFLDRNPEDLSVKDLPSPIDLDYILFTSVEDNVDLVAIFKAIKPLCSPKTRIILLHYNFLWFPLVRLAEILGLKTEQRLHNWVSVYDLNRFLTVTGLEVLTHRGVLLFPFRLPILSTLLNRVLAKLPLFRLLTFIRISVVRNPDPIDYEPTVSVVIPCKNEAGNVRAAVERVPEMGAGTELVFCDDRSTDGTREEIQKAIKEFPKRNIRLVEGPGISKAENVWRGFEAAQNEVLMILDGDLTVLPEELPYFYETIRTNRGEFVNGSRSVYPRQKSSMPFSNAIGNKLFSILFSYILEESVKDTLCGTKVLWKRDYLRLKKWHGSWGPRDRWGDYDLLFGAARSHLKIVDLPVHYTDRSYGVTKMTNRFHQGWRMLRMCFSALLRIKFSS